MSPAACPASRRRPGWAGRRPSCRGVETGRFGASLTEVADLLDFYGAPEEVRAELLARVARRDGPAGAWVVRAGGSRRRTASLGQFESRVSWIRQYAATAVPGLLQAPQYTAALLRVGGWDPAEDIAAARLARQERTFGRKGLGYSCVLDARALTRWPGGPAVMRAQLDHLASLPKSVTLRVLPPGSNSTAAPLGSFIVYEFGETAPVVVLCETQTADLYLSDDQDVATYTQLMDDLLRSSLSVKDTRTYLVEVSRTLREVD